MKKTIKSVIFSLRKLPEKKHYVEFFTALLSVPVLITVIMLNLNNLQSSNKKAAVITPQITQQTIYVPESKNSNNTVTSTPAPTITTSISNSACNPDIGPVSITSPAEGDTVTNNPVNITIDYKTGTYCAVVWSYRINNGNWSDYDDKSIALYNVSQGNVKIDLRVKSIANGSEKDLTRNFVYKGESATATITNPPDTQMPVKSSASAN